MNSAIPNPTALLEELRGLRADQRAGRVLSFGPLNGTLQQLIDAATSLVASDAASAIEATTIVTALADEIGRPIDRARARRGHVRALAYAGRFDEALTCCGEAIEISESNGDVIEAGRARLASMHALCELGRLDEAIAAGEAARRSFVDSDEPALVARADINLGIAFHRSDEPAGAVRCFERARPLLGDGSPVAGHLENSLGEALVAINQFDGAEAAFGAALVHFEQNGQTLNAGIAEGNLADLAYREGRLQRALRFFERARRRFETDDARVHHARLQSEMADAEAVLGLPEDALADYEIALPELERCGLVLETARARLGRGLVLAQLERYDEADRELRTAAAVYRQLGHDSAQAKVDLVRAEIARQLGGHDEATALATAALTALDERPADAAAAGHLMARLAMESDEFDAAERHLDEAMETARRLDLAPLSADLLHCRCELEHRRGRVDQAVLAGHAAVNQVERIRGTFQADRFRTAFLGHRAVIYESLVAALLDQETTNAAAEVFAVAELAKSRSLLEHARGAMGWEVGDTAAGAESVETRLGAELEALRSELNALYSRLWDDGAASAGSDAWAAHRDAIASRETRLRAIEGRLASARGTAGLFAQPTTLHQARERLGAGEVLVEYFIARGELLAVVAGRERTWLFRGLGKAADLGERVRRLQFQIDRALRRSNRDGNAPDRLVRDAQRELQALHEMLMAPLAPALEGAGRLTIVPHGVMHLVPFHALFDGRRYLVESYEMHGAPSASLLGMRRASAPHADGEPLVCGVADQVSPCMEEEASAVARLIGADEGRTLLGARATVGRVIAAAPSASMIHLACHGRFSASNPLGSGIRLADGWLTVRDIYALRLDADLVTLSGCETGVNLVHAGDELTGLVRGFLAAGCRSVLVSLWRVHDESAMEFMCRFCRHQGVHDASGSCHNGRAVRLAQLELLDERAHPAFWAPFALVGES